MIVVGVALLEGLVPVGWLSPVRDGHNPFMITESVSPPCTPAPKLHGELTLSAILNRLLADHLTGCARLAPAAPPGGS